MHCWVSTLSYTRSTKTICLKISAYSCLISLLSLKESQTCTISASESFCSQLCRWQFLWQLCKWQCLLNFCRFWGGTFFYWYVDGSFCYNYAGDSFCCNYTARCFCSTYAVTVSATNVWMLMGVSVTIIQVVFSAVHYVYTWLFQVTISYSVL